MVTLAELWLRLGPTHAGQALALLHQCMTMVLGHGGRELTARIYLAIARSHLCSSSFSGYRPSFLWFTDQYNALLSFNHRRFVVQVYFLFVDQTFLREYFYGLCIYIISMEYSCNQLYYRQMSFDLLCQFLP